MILLVALTLAGAALLCTTAVAAWQEMTHGSEHVCDMVVAFSRARNGWVLAT